MACWTQRINRPRPRPVLARFSSYEDQQAALKQAPQVRAHRCADACRTRIGHPLCLLVQWL